MLLWPFNKYPGTDYETFNWEWILKTVKEWVATMQTFKNDITAAWNAMRADWKGFETGMTNDWRDYQDNLNDQWQEFIDDTYKDQITEILEDHPEWVTTVMDGAITEPKINATFLKEIKNLFETPQMYGAVGDGVTDDTNAFNTALTNTKYLFVPAGTYLIDADSQGWGHLHEGGIQVPDGAIILMDSKATLKAKTNSTGFYSVLNIHDANNVLIHGGNIEGERNTHIETSDEYGHGVRISKCENITIENMNISDTWGDGVLIASEDEATGNNNNITLKNLLIDRARRNGVSVVIGENITIDSCEIKNVAGTKPQAGIDIESSADQDIGKVVVKNCYIHDNAVVGIIASHRATLLIVIDSDVQAIQSTYDAKNVQIENCNTESITVGADLCEVNNTITGRINIQSGNLLASNCNIKGNNNYTHLVQSGVDNMSYKTSEFVKFVNCVFKAISNTTHLLYGGYTGTDVPETDIEFSNCKIDLTTGNNASFCNRMPGGSLRVHNCDINMPYRYQLFTSLPFTPCKAILTGNRFRTTSPDYLFSIDGVKTVEIVLANNIVDYVRLAYCGGASDGTIIRTGNITVSDHPETVTGGSNTVNVISAGNSV